MSGITLQNPDKSGTAWPDATGLRSAHSSSRSRRLTARQNHLSIWQAHDSVRQDHFAMRQKHPAMRFTFPAARSGQFSMRQNLSATPENQVTVRQVQSAMRQNHSTARQNHSAAPENGLVTRFSAQNTQKQRKTALLQLTLVGRVTPCAPPRARPRTARRGLTRPTNLWRLGLRQPSSAFSSAGLATQKRRRTAALQNLADSHAFTLNPQLSTLN